MKRIFTKRGEQPQVEAQQVLYLMGDINYAYLHLITGEVVLACRTLKWFSHQWPAFLRLHKKALVNPAYVASCQVAEKPSGPHYVIMQDAAQLPIARRRAAEVINQLGSVAEQRPPGNAVE